MEQPLRVSGHTRHRHLADVPRGEEAIREFVPAAAQGRLPGTAVLVDDQRMHIAPTPARRDQLHAVRPPVRLDDIAQVAQSGQYLTLERAVDVQVDIPMRSGLAADEGIDAPPALDPEAAADGTDGVEHGE